MCVRAFFTLLVPSYQFACQRRWWSCCACRSLLVRPSLSFPMCAGVWGRAWSLVVAASPCAGFACNSWAVCLWPYLSLPLLACQREHGSRLHPFGYLRAVHVTNLRLCWRSGALSGGVLLPSCLQLALCAAAYLLHPMQAGMRGWACVPAFTSWLPFLAWLSLCFSRSAASNILGSVSRWPVLL